MKRWFVVVAVGVACIAGAVFFTPLNQVVYDPAPPAEAVAETVVIDQPVPAMPVEKPATDPAAPLTRHLVIRAAVPATVPQGAVQLPPGMPVELVADHGAKVNVKFGHKEQAVTVAVARAAVTSRGELPPIAQPSSIDVIRQKVVDMGHAPASSLAIEAKEVGTGFGVARSFDALAGSSDKSTFRTKGLTVTVRNLSRRPTGEFDINVYWTGRRLADNQLHITHGESFRANIAGVAQHETTSWCPLLDSRITTFDWTSTRNTSGSKFDGWFVVVTRDDQMLVGRGATETYNSLIRDSTQLQPLLATWTGSNRHATGTRPLWRHERPGQSAIPQDRTAVPRY